MAAESAVAAASAHGMQRAANRQPGLGVDRRRSKLALPEAHIPALHANPPLKIPFRQKRFLYTELQPLCWNSSYFGASSQPHECMTMIVSNIFHHGKIMRKNVSQSHFAPEDPAADSGPAPEWTHQRRDRLVTTMNFGFNASALAIADALSSSAVQLVRVGD